MSAAASAHLILFSRRALSFPAMLACLLVGAAFIVARPFNVDPDMWWHVKVGDTLLATHHWPTTKPYSFTLAASPGLRMNGWVTRSLRVHSVWRDFRDLKHCSFFSEARPYWRSMLWRDRGGNVKGGSVAVVLLLILASALFSMRPQMLGYLFLILMVIALERFRLGKRKCCGSFRS